MQIKADEITRIIEQQIRDFAGQVDVKETGTVISVGDGIARVYGLENVMYNELLVFPRDLYGVALNLEEDSVGVMLLGETILVKEGQTVSRGQEIAEMGNSDTDSVKLHFEIRQQGKPVDPTKYLPSR